MRGTSSPSRLLLLAAVAAFGCGEGPPAAAPAASYDPPAVAEALMKEFDRDGNGSIEGAELDGCPALKAALAQIDQNKDRKLSRDELQKRIERYAAAGQGSLAYCSVQAKLDGKPLARAKVTFVPEKAMGPRFKPASGVTNDDGQAVLIVDGDTRAGVPAGLYRIQVTKDGAEKALAAYGPATPLGREVFDDGRSGGALIELSLSSRR